MATFDRRLHARQLLLVEIGEHGQQRLCETRVAIAASAEPYAAEVAREYLERAGLGVIATGAAREPLDPVEQPTPEVAVADRAAVRALAGAVELEQAAATLAGAFAAVEAIKAALGLAEPAALPDQLSLRSAGGA